ILSTQWTTTSAKPLMEAFVSHLQAGSPKDSALYLAKLSLIDTDIPYHWAAYEIQGDMDKIDEARWKSSSAYRLWWTLLASLAVAGGLFYLWRRRSRVNQARPLA
ncbi:MAG: CHAT domain-containing protein, partial [Bacteroidota bacterium]